MQSQSTKLFSALDKNVELRFFSKVVGEWELNSYYDYTIDIVDSINPLLFPAEDILRARRPLSGLPKFLAGSGKVTSNNVRPRFRIPSRDSAYKYFVSADFSDSEGNINFYADVNYDQDVKLNKIVVGFDISYCSPEDVEIYLRRDDGEDGWDFIGIYQPGPDGTVVANFDGFWDQQDGESQETFEYVAFDTARGIRVVVNKISEPNQPIHVIQISPRLVIDLSDRVIATEIDKVREERSLVNPIGISTSSRGSINLSNHDRIFDPENEESILYNLIDRNSRFDIWTVVDTRPLKQDFVSDDFEFVKQMTCFADSYNFSSDSTVSIDIRDRSKFLQDEMIRQCFYKDKTTREIVEDILERSGIIEYDFRSTVEDDKTVIPFIFFNNDKSVWESLQSIAIAEQSVFYFDENDVFVWESRDYLWSEPVVNYELRARADEDKLANIESFSYQYELDVNKVQVNWTPTETPKSNGSDINNVLWEQKDDLVLGASPLISDIDLQSEFFSVVEGDAVFFPTDGIVNINGEYIRYERLEETPEVFNIKQRGLFNSSPAEHVVEPSSDFWSFYTLHGGNQRTDGNSPLARYWIQNSLLKIVSPLESFNTVSHFEGGDITDSYGIYGCRLKFPLRNLEDELPDYEGDGIAGIFINSDGDRGGYYFELTTSAFAFRSEIAEREARIWRFDEDGNPEILLGYVPEVTDILTEEDFFSVAGTNIVVAPGENYDLHVAVSDVTDFDAGEDSDFKEFRFFVNGQPVLSFIDNQFTEGKWGVFSRAKTAVEFEYVYVIDRRGVEADISSSANKIRDYITGGFKSNVLASFLNEFNQLRSDVIVEDFGPWVQEAKEFDIEYEVSPGLSANLFLSREDDVGLVYFDRGPYSSRFVLANKSRSFIVVSGSDPVSGASMKVFIYGVPIIQRESNSYQEIDEKSVWNRGVQELVVQSPFIQTEDHARRAASWVVSRWARPTDFVGMSVIINPSIQIGDLVSVSIPEENFFPETHLYHIVQINQTIGTSNEMSLTLRRARF